jgi:transposase-like protein
MSLAFKGRHFAPNILFCLRWYCFYAPSYLDLEEMMAERHLSVDHTTIYRWIQLYALELDRRF